ncbi:hypothetical protein BBI17_008938, partial [Phytophthora kernoviae]
YSFVVTIIILIVLKYTVGLRVDEEKEVNGIDVSYHGGLAYDYNTQDHSNPAVKVANPPSTNFASMMSPTATQEAKEPIMNV